MSVELPGGQDGGAHDVPFAYLRQPPAPSQKPSVPQLALPWSWQTRCGSALPLGTFVHTPGVVGSAHDWQVPLQSVVQQTDCAQKFEWHSAAEAQVWPSPLSPHEPLLQTAGAVQSELVLHAALQAFPPH